MVAGSGSCWNNSVNTQAALLFKPYEKLFSLPFELLQEEVFMPTYRNSIFLTVSLLSMSVFLQAVPTAHAEVINLEVLNPIASMEVERVVPTPRPANLDNKRILLYWNRKLHTDVAVDQVKKQLEKRFAGLELKIGKGSP
jgi:hypothetical protein